ncbi:MAG TPA: histidine kinase [Sphingobium sp.]|nr:histidine kinase [Sphingobium sp.]
MAEGGFHWLAPQGRPTGLFGRWPRWLPVNPNPERLISASRLIATIFAALAIYLDPTRPSGFLREAHVVLGGYLAFSLWLTVAAPRWPLRSPAHLISHGVDVLAMVLLVYFTDELTSPFFPFLPFILMATTMRWGIRGAVLGALVMEVMLIGVGWNDLWDGDAELNLLIMRSAYFMIAAAMLGYFSASLARSSHRFAQLAAWSFAPATADKRAWLRDMLDHAAGLLGSDWVVLLWRDHKGGSGTLALRGPDGLHLSEIGDPAFWRARSASLSQDELSRRTAVAELQAIAAAAGWPQLSDVAGEVRSAPFAGSSIGRLFVLDRRERQEDVQPLTQITAVRIGHELERLALVRAIADNARDQERVRLARDLHDSVLQELTAASFKLKTAGSAMPESAREPLNSVVRIMSEQQRKIRLFVENSRTLEAMPPPMLSSCLAQSVNELCDQWGCEIALSIDPPDIEAPSTISRDITQLLCEATANAVRHGGATRLSVELERQEKGLRMVIADNGCGMTVSDDQAPHRPRSLHERIRDMDGSLSITRYAPGLAMTIEVPLP